MARSLMATKHYALAKALRQEFRQMRPGDPICTVREIKERFGVSQATVSRALDRLRRDDVIHRPTGRARLFISEIAPRALHRVSIIRPTWPSPDYDALVRELLHIGQQRGWAFDIIAAAPTLDEVDLEKAIGGNDGAVLLFSARHMPAHIAAALRKPRKPVVLMREVPAELPVNGVCLDDVEVGRLAVAHLGEKGHRRILAVVSEPAMRSVEERVIGWREGMEKLGVKDCDALLLDCCVPPGRDSTRHTYEVMRRWLDGRRPDFTAIFCIHWMGALAVMRALREVTGLSAPKDVSVMVFAGESLLLPYLNPPLTAVEFDMRAYAQATVDLLQKQFDDPNAAMEQVRIAPFVVERGSTRALGSEAATTMTRPVMAP